MEPMVIARLPLRITITHLAFGRLAVDPKCDVEGCRGWLTPTERNSALREINSIISRWAPQWLILAPSLPVVVGLALLVCVASASSVAFLPENTAPALGIAGVVFLVLGGIAMLWVHTRAQNTAAVVRWLLQDMNRRYGNLGIHWDLVENNDVETEACDEYAGHGNARARVSKTYTLVIQHVLVGAADIDWSDADHTDSWNALDDSENVESRSDSVTDAEVRAAAKALLEGVANLKGGHDSQLPRTKADGDCESEDSYRSEASFDESEKRIALSM
eukprot:TRINITY_DN17368_c0_g1_i3.p1 TRINITY_DN17368_c0_g1~~TRINITY_DN17368_c0_g1_i3.p1  ORF type:complete len:275 (-),score=31.71 TRINITY_DN17368_c0_g1_i3:185-1009(-)